MFLRAPTQVRVPPTATPKATVFPQPSVERRPPSQISTGPPAVQLSPAHRHACAIPAESRGDH
ncbi:hypothetical protein GCM10010469_63820 [Streptomyces labedae]|uniref:Uncharacterized protein n=1 Tax=Streptomyces labedae TaxID=285569 RepID=A0ABP6RB45_9ACTN